MAGNIHFILVESEVAANVGATSRAMKNMGFSNLHLVNPKCDYLGGEARALACSSQELLENATVWSDFTKLRAHFDILIATTTDIRATKKPYVAAEKVQAYFNDVPEGLKVGIVFGRERNGLTTAEIESCESVTSLELANPHPALNLSQAVMLYAFIISQRPSREVRSHRDDLEVDIGETVVLKKKVQDFLQLIGLKGEDRSFREVLSRLPFLKPRDLRLVLFILAKIEKKFGSIQSL